MLFDKVAVTDWWMKEEGKGGSGTVEGEPVAVVILEERKIMTKTMAVLQRSLLFISGLSVIY